MNIYKNKQITLQDFRNKEKPDVDFRKTNQWRGFCSVRPRREEANQRVSSPFQTAKSVVDIFVNERIERDVLKGTEDEDEGTN